MKSINLSKRELRKVINIRNNIAKIFRNVESYIDYSVYLQGNIDTSRARSIYKRCCLYMTNLMSIAGSHLEEGYRTEDKAELKENLVAFLNMFNLVIALSDTLRDKIEEVNDLLRDISKKDCTKLHDTLNKDRELGKYYNRSTSMANKNLEDAEEFSRSLADKNAKTELTRLDKGMKKSAADQVKRRAKIKKELFSKRKYKKVKINKIKVVDPYKRVINFNIKQSQVAKLSKEIRELTKKININNKYRSSVTNELELSALDQEILSYQRALNKVTKQLERLNEDDN